MALPIARQNLVGCQVTNQDLNLVVAASANVTTQVSATIQDEAPRSTVVLIQVVSGTLVVDGKIGSGTISDPSSSPTDTVTLNATSTRGFIKLDTTSDNPYWALKLTSTGANVTKFVVLDLAKLASGEDAPAIGCGQLGYDSAVNGDGSGVFPIGV